MNDLPSLIQQAPESAIAIIIPETGTSVTYGSLRKQVHSLAESMAGAGIRRGDRVANVLPNGLGTIVTFLASSIAGTAAPLNPAYKYEEFVFYLEDTNAKLLLVPPEGAEEARRAAEHMKVPVYVVATNGQGEVTMVNGPTPVRVTPPSPDDIALVLHTSGSTGRPKRVPLKHRNLAISTGNIVETYGLTSKDRSLLRDAIVPRAWTGGLHAVDFPHRRNRDCAGKV